MKFISFFAAQTLLFTAAAQAQMVRGTILDGAQIVPRGSHSIVIPNSNMQLPLEIGVAAHTNVQALIPAAPLNNANSPPALAMTNGAKQAAAIGEPSPIRPATSIGQPPFLGLQYETPASLACLHGLAPRVNGCNPNLVTQPSSGGSKAVAVVIAYHYPNAAADLATYSKQFGLPLPTANTFQVVFASGAQPANNPSWEFEAALDIEMTHAMAPKAKLFLVEARSNQYADLLLAVDKAGQLVAAAGGGEVTMSWGGGEFSAQTGFDSHFATSGVVYFASSGDSPGVLWPATSANVVAVGGASIARDPASFNFKWFNSWSEGGSGASLYAPAPPYQSSIASIAGTKKRVVPDIAAVANAETGVWVYDSGNGGWAVAGGTSAASPVMAGITNASGSFAKSTVAHLTKIYANKAANATAYGVAQSGYCGHGTANNVAPAWNFCVGVGIPISLSTQ